MEYYSNKWSINPSQIFGNKRNDKDFKHNNMVPFLVDTLHKMLINMRIDLY